MNNELQKTKIKEKRDKIKRIKLIIQGWYYHHRHHHRYQHRHTDHMFFCTSVAVRSSWHSHSIE